MAHRKFFEENFVTDGDVLYRRNYAPVSTWLDAYGRNVDADEAQRLRTAYLAYGMAPVVYRMVKLYDENAHRDGGHLPLLRYARNLVAAVEGANFNKTPKIVGDFLLLHADRPLEAGAFDLTVFNELPNLWPAQTIYNAELDFLSDVRQRIKAEAKAASSLGAAKPSASKA